MTYANKSGANVSQDGKQGAGGGTYQVVGTKIANKENGDELNLHGIEIRQKGYRHPPFNAQTRGLLE